MKSCIPWSIFVVVLSIVNCWMLFMNACLHSANHSIVRYKPLVHTIFDLARFFFSPLSHSIKPLSISQIELKFRIYTFQTIRCRITMRILFSKFIRAQSCFNNLFRFTCHQRTHSSENKQSLNQINKSKMHFNDKRLFY